MKGMLIQLWMILFACFISLGGTAQIIITSQPGEVLIGDHFQLKFEVDNSGQQIERVQWITDLIKDLEDVVIIQSSVSEADNKFVKELTLAVFDTGEVSLARLAAEIFLKDGRLEVEFSAELSIRSLLPGDLKGELQPIKDIIEDPPPSFLWLYFVIAVLVLMLLGLLWLMLRKTKKQRLAPEPKADFSAINPEEWAIRQIQELRKASYDDPAGEEAYFTRLSYIFRNWIKNRFAFKALEMTGYELMEELNNREIYSQSLLSEVRAVIEKIEQIKYAKGRADNGFRELSTSFIEELIRNKKQELERHREGTND